MAPASTPRRERLHFVSGEAVRCFQSFRQLAVDVREACRCEDDEKVVSLLEERSVIMEHATLLVAELLAARDADRELAAEAETLLARVSQAAAEARSHEAELEFALAATHQQVGRNIEQLDSIASRSEKYRHPDESHRRSIDLMS